MTTTTAPPRASAADVLKALENLLALAADVATAEDKLERAAKDAKWTEGARALIDAVPFKYSGAARQEILDALHDAGGKGNTIETLRWRLKRPLDDYRDTSLADLEHMTDELARFASRLPERFRYSVMSALRQACEAGVRYGYMTKNPAKLAGSNPMPSPRAARIYTPKELEKIVEELVVELPRSRWLPRPGYVPQSGPTSNAATSTHSPGAHGARHEDAALEA